MTKSPDRIRTNGNGVYGHLPDMTFTAETEPGEYLLSTPAREAAEELLEALENVMGYADTPIGRRKLGISPYAKWLIDARAAITKAKGE